MAKQQLSADEESILKRQARRRLIGAVALTTAVVVVLPMVFDSEPAGTTTVNDIELVIPDKDKVGEFQPASSIPALAASEVVPVSAPLSTSMAASATSPVLTAVVATAAVATVVAPHLAQEKQVTPVKAEAQISNKAEAKPEAKINSAPESKSSPKSEVKPTASAKPKTETHVAPHSGFVVQVGAFSNAATAQALQDKLNKQGLNAYTEKVGSNVRVRIGGFASRDAAEKVRHKLESQGQRPNVVNLGP